MSRTGFWVSAGIAAVITAIMLSVAVLVWGGRSAGYQAGPWTMNPDVGSPDAGLYTRALVAVFGLLALNREEAVYYTATTDNDGNLLSGDCTYRLNGQDLPVRWWSITPYGTDNYLMRHDQAGHYSLTQTSVQSGEDGSYTAVISAEPHAQNWLPVAPGQRFDLTARLYNPEPEVWRDPAAVALPQIIREDCT